MRITHISVTDIKGGAARAAYRLHFARLVTTRVCWWQSGLVLTPMSLRFRRAGSRHCCGGFDTGSYLPGTGVAFCPDQKAMVPSQALVHGKELLLSASYRTLMF